MKGKPLQVLWVEDKAGDARLLREISGKVNAGSFIPVFTEGLDERERYAS